MNWYEEWFGRDYLEVYAHRNREEAVKQVDFLERVLGLKKGTRIFDLCCGSGRHSIELTRRGYEVIGMDLSCELLEQAQLDLEKAGIAVTLIRGDMRNIPYQDYFDTVINCFTSFGYFEKEEENLQVLYAIARALKPSGKFLIDYLNHDYIVKNYIPRSEEERSDIRIIQERSIDAIGGRINKTITLIKGDQKKVYKESVRAFTYPEMQRMTSSAGLVIEAVYGDYEGKSFTWESPRMILVGRKP